MDALIAITLVLAAMIAGIYRKISLDQTLLVGVLLTSVLFGRIAHILDDAAGTLIEADTINLMLLIYLVFLLNNILAATGTMKKVVDSLERMVTDPRIIIALIPAVIGLMPVLSGAVISAPFADQIGKKAGISKERRHTINYWFRHISEYVNPIYPGVLLATGMLGLSFYTFFLANLPVLGFYILMGAIFLLKGMSRPHVRPVKVRANDLATVLLGVAPILVAVVAPVMFKIELTTSLAIAIIVALALHYREKKDLLLICKDSLKMDLLALVFLVMLFKTVLDNTNAAQQISSSLMALGVPTTALLVVVPMLVGFLTGLTLGFVGLTFPILLPFLKTAGALNIHAVTLAYVSGYLGILLSPMHLCFSVTQKYFNADIKGIYRIIAPPIILTFIWTLIYATMT